MKLSVIIPLYNAQDYIAEALDSLFAQKGIELEVIVVDDESKDNSAEVAKRFDIKYYKKPNGGASAARNYGLRFAVGDYVMFLDADDYLKDDLICKNCIDLIKSKNLDFAMFTYQYYNTATKLYGVSVRYPENLHSVYDSVGLTSAMVRCGIYPASPCFKIMRRQFLVDNSLTFIEGTTSEDVEWFTRLLLLSKRYAIIDNDAYVYRKGVETSVTGSFTIKKCWNFINIMHKSCEKVAICENTLLRESLYSALCYDYYILLGDSAPFITDKDVLRELTSLKFLCKYTQFPRTKILGLVMSVIGVKNMSRFLAYMINHHSKSSK